MSVIKRVVKATTRKGKKVLLSKEPKLVESPKRALFFQGRKTSEMVRRVLKDIYDLKKPDCLRLSRNNDVTIFEDATPVETFCRKHDTSIFLMGSHSKKRPNNLVMGRTYNYSLLDMVELAIESYKGIAEFPNEKVTLGCKPCLVFNGPAWDETAELKQLKSILIDFFHREEVEYVRLQGLEHALSFTATGDGKVHLRSYRICLKKSGCKTPRIELEEIGPRLDFAIRRSKLPSEDLMKQACRQPKELKITTKKNITTDKLGTTHGRIHVGKQHIEKVQVRKMKGLKKTVQVRKVTKQMENSGGGVENGVRRNSKKVKN